MLSCLQTAEILQLYILFSIGCKTERVTVGWRKLHEECHNLHFHQGPVARSFKHGKEHTGSKEYVQIYGQLSTDKLLMAPLHGVGVMEPCYLF
jgi:hypothetical protein